MNLLLRVVLGLVLCGVAYGQELTSNTNQSAPSQSAAKPDQPASVPFADTTQQYAHLRVYRQRRYMGSALAPSIYVDEKQVARLGNGRRVTVRLTPGNHDIRSDDKSSAISLDARPGQEYFVRVDEEPGFLKGHGKLTMLMPEQGTAEYKLQKPVEEERKVAKDLIEDDSAIADIKKR
jgi:hypothetical protein